MINSYSCTNVAFCPISLEWPCTNLLASYDLSRTNFCWLNFFPLFNCFVLFFICYLYWYFMWIFKLLPLGKIIKATDFIPILEMLLAQNRSQLYLILVYGKYRELMIIYVGSQYEIRGWSRTENWLKSNVQNLKKVAKFLKKKGLKR